MKNSRRAETQLFLMGFLTLFAELALIRYLAGNIWNLGYFPNLVLLAVFFGIGIGFVSHDFVSYRRSGTLFEGAIVMLGALLAFVLYGRPAVPGFGKWQGEVGGEVFFTSTAKGGEGGLLPLVVTFLAVVVIFALIAGRTAKLFRQFPPLTAYTLDIAGSCCGIVAFMLASFFRFPAWSWMLFLALLHLGATDPGENRRWRSMVFYALVVLLAFRQDRFLLDAGASKGPHLTNWSPYQKVEFTPRSDPLPTIYVNGISHQVIFTLDQLRRTFYQAIYRDRSAADRPPYRQVLIIGSGSGNDVSLALDNGAEHVDAVEIDPVIADIGRDHHPAHPYDDPRVRLVIDDGRAFMSRTDRHYDLIVFALTDSLVKVSAMAQLRLENYLFTKESVRRACRLLSDQGDLVFYNFYRQPWLVLKLRKMMFEGTAIPPRIVARKGDFSVLKVTKGDASKQMTLPDEVDTPTDDWPFLYLKKRGIPAVYFHIMLLFAALVLVIMAVLQRLQHSRSGPSTALSLKLAFLCMGAAFLLLETKSVIQFSLLFGTTWLTNSLVFLGILLLVLAANWTVLLLRGRSLFWPIYLLLILSCAVGFLYPVGNLLAVKSLAGRFLAASVLTFAPVYFANLLFSYLFQSQKVAEHLFGWNLLGASLGGIAEYGSMAIGYNALAVIVGLLYTLAFALAYPTHASRKVQKVADHSARAEESSGFAQE